jgi:hypothetical protein
MWLVTRHVRDKRGEPGSVFIQVVGNRAVREPADSEPGGLQLPPQKEELGTG